MRIDNALLRRDMQAANAAHVESKARLKTLSAYTNGIAHDMGTPLAALSMALQLLDETELQRLDQRELIADMHVAEEMLRLITRKALDHSKYVSGVKLVPNMARTDLREIVAKSEKVIKRYSPSLKDIDLHFHVDNNIAPVILTDGTWVWEIIINLLSNAIKFCIHGSVNLSLDVVEREESVGMAGDVENLLLQVTDTGPGIPLDKLDTLFQPFVQLQTNAGGSGLGLVTVALQATALGGTFGVKTHSEPHGSVFWVRLPYMPVADLEQIPAADVDNMVKPGVEENENAQMSVLIIEDTGSVRKLSKIMLQKRGFVVHEAEDGLSGLVKMKEQEYSIVLCDLMMPVMDGCQTMKLYRQWAEEQSLPYHQRICALSAQANTETYRACIDAGMDAMLSKPLRTDEFMSMLTQRR